MPLTYQWTDPGNNPVGQNSNVLSLTNLQTSQSGTYTLTVMNSYGTATTNFTLQVDAGAPQIVNDLQPASVTVYAGNSVTLSWQVSGTQPLTYKWFKNATPIVGASNSGTYTITALAGTNVYSSSASNVYSPGAGGPLFSGNATVIGIPAPTVNPADFTDKVKISFAGYNRGETLQDFPVLVKLGTNVPGFTYADFASPTGGDLRFADARARGRCRSRSTSSTASMAPQPSGFKCRSFEHERLYLGLLGQLGEHRPAELRNQRLSLVAGSVRKPAGLPNRLSPERKRAAVSRFYPTTSGYQWRRDGAHHRRRWHRRFVWLAPRGSMRERMMWAMRLRSRPG